ncbi:MAG: translocation/assembly module TamB domain-containing protein, partial [Desulfovibrionaceae bacterium]|nr:translocation/assembly module TamB domain-containing protein [Desulfovibrionaceae bacterium]
LLDSLNLEGQKLEDFNLKLLGSPLDLASFLRLKEARALALNLDVTGKLNNKPLSLNLPLYASLLTNDYQSLKCGVRDLNLQALGLEARATLETLLGSLKSPQIKGELKASIKDWQQIGALVPDFKLEGEVETLATLNYDQGQKANVNLNIPHFKVKNKEEALLNLAHLQLNLSLEDLFKVPAFKTTLTSQSIAAGPLLIATEAKAKGSLTGPIDLSLKTSGNLETSLDLQYEKDKVKINTLQVLVATSLLNLKAETKSLNQAASRPKSKAKAPKNQSNRNRRASSKSQKETQSLKVASLRHIGLRLTSPTELTFNDQGINLKNTQVALLPSGSLNAALGLNPQKFGADVNLKGLDLTPWKGLIKEIPEGLIEAELKLHGSPKDPRGNLRLGVSKLKVDRVPLEPLDLALTGQITNQKSLNLKLDLPASSLSKIGLEALNLQASLPLIFAENGVPNVHLKGNLSGQVKIKGRLAKLWKLAPLPEYRLTGDLDGDVRVAGTLEALKVNGGVKIQGGRFEDPINGLLLRDLGLMVDLDGKVAGNNLGGGVKINGGFSDGMGGTFTLKGQTSLDASKIDIATKIDHLRPLRRNDVRISLSGDTKITGSAADPYISGTIVVDNGALQLENVEAGPSGVSTLPITTKEEIPKAKDEAKPKAESLQKEGAGGGRINLAIKSPGKFLVDGFGLTSAWQTDLKVTGPLTNPLISGEISCVKGNLDFLNKDFVMEKGVVTLAGGNVANPIIDMLLTNTTADFTSHIRIAGTVKKLKLTLSSEPEMPQDDVLAHILFGRNANELGRYEALQLAAAVARMGSGLGSGLNNPRKSLGMDVMRLKSGGNNNGKDDTGMSGMALETGKYLTDSLYVGVEQGAKEGSSAGIVQLEITPKLKLELRSQQNNTKGSLNWKYNF